MRATGQLEQFGVALDQYKLLWKGYDLKETWRQLGCELQNAVWDQMLAAYVIRAGNQETFSELYKRYVGEGLPELPTSFQLYICHQRLELALVHRLHQISGERVYESLELPLVPILHRMEKHGIKIDLKELSSQSTELSKDIHRLEKSIHEQAKEVFNIASPKQLGQVLFVKLGMPPGKKTKTGFSTDNEVLEGLKEQYPICGDVLLFREFMKLKSTYVDALPQLVSSATGRVHTHFNQALTTTGRLSSTNPNLQNIPIRTDRGNMVRKAFIAEEGYLLLSADYSQIELRILAHITDDPGLCRAFSEEQDIHSATASEVFGVSIQDVTSDLRRTAKAINFGIAYGQGAFGLAQTLGISNSEAAKIISNYFTKFPKVHQFMSDVVESAKKQGYVETLFGRRRYIEELKSSNANIRKFGERAAINAPIQGSASDLVKKAMIDLPQNLIAQLLLQVHDELVFECLASEASQTAATVKSKMETVFPLKVPLKVNVAWGKNWDEAHS
jgi:DNA polymerase-1